MLLTLSKNPWLCDYLDEVLTDGEIIIEHAIVPVRDLFSAAQSRRGDDQHRSGGLPEWNPRGTLDTDMPEQQEQVLASQLYKLIYVLAKRDIPMTLLFFPKIIHDSEYLYRKIAFALNGVSFEI